jgi:hypothetical protein
MARQETGTTPSKAVERLRIEVARLRVQSSSEAIERVAQSTGFRDPERMRRAFGQPPQSLRGWGRDVASQSNGVGGCPPAFQAPEPHLPNLDTRFISVERRKNSA